MPPVSNDASGYIDLSPIDFLEEFQKMIDEYNAGSSNVETFFAKLMAFTNKLNEEEKRGIAEQLTEEELVIFDLLTKPDITLTNQETADVKKVAKALLEKLKQEKLVLDWRKQQTTRAMVFTTIKDVLDELPRTYTKDPLDADSDSGRMPMENQTPDEKIFEAEVDFTARQPWVQSGSAIMAMAPGPFLRDAPFWEKRRIAFF